MEVTRPSVRFPVIAVRPHAIPDSVVDNGRALLVKDDTTREVWSIIDRHMRVTSDGDAVKCVTVCLCERC